MHISGVLVHALPEHAAQVQEQLAAIPGVEVHNSDVVGKLIVTLEEEDEQATVDTFGLLSELPDVLAATMVYHHFEPETDSK
ncbi:MAG: chaperone NapD [Sulfurimicrobium sp.]|nr:chaperone NapD [Sulfurimicrobium sp.]MDP1896720.1 chaperone NapD [Sulfurimicrobium sp.]MDP2199522.1 chaperone NapD [Sulfurimicrobium sp.]MDZ7656500.1 chaperone NapD [Sulfurimicrobium sp.]